MAMKLLFSFLLLVVLVTADKVPGGAGRLRRFHDRMSKSLLGETQILSKKSTCDSTWYANLPNPNTLCKYTTSDSATDIGGVSDADQKIILDTHNALRKTASPAASNMQTMYWDDKMADLAQWMAQACNGNHDTWTERRVKDYGINLGQNIAMGSALTWEEAIKNWHAEVSNFTYGTEGSDTGHYTQVMSAIANRVGCGYAYCPNLSYEKYFYCNYAYGQDDAIQAAPYTSGSACADCSGHCTDGLCDCGADILCLNGGSLDPATCTCNCVGVFSGSDCSTSDCSGSDPSYCVTGYCQYTNMAPICAQTCGNCP